MEIQQNSLDTLPYKQDCYPKDGVSSTASGTAQDGHNPSRFEPLERTANPGLTQRLEYLVYTEGVGGSNPSARTIPPAESAFEAIICNLFHNKFDLRPPVAHFIAATKLRHAVIYLEVLYKEQCEALEELLAVANKEITVEELFACHDTVEAYVDACLDVRFRLRKKTEAA